MTPGSLPLKLYKGDTYHWRIAIWVDSDKTQPADLTGVIAKAEIRDKSGGTVLSILNCSITDNVIDMTLDAKNSQSVNTGMWDLQLTYLTGEIVTILAGKVTVTGDITDSSITMSPLRIAS